MVANDRDNGAGENPFIRGFGWVVVVNSTAGGVAAVNGISGSTVGGVCHSGIDATVIQTRKSAGLIDDACQCIGETGVGYSIEDDSSHRYLTGIGFPSSLRRNDPGEKGHFICTITANARNAGRGIT